MIMTRKRGRKRFFYQNGRKIAHYDIEGNKPATLKANIFLEGKIIENGINSIVVHATDFENFDILAMKKFLKENLGKELMTPMYVNLRGDLLFPDEFASEKVLFI